MFEWRLAKVTAFIKLFFCNWRFRWFTRPANRKMGLVIVAATLAGNMKIVAYPTMKKYASALPADMR